MKRLYVLLVFILTGSLLHAQPLSKLNFSANYYPDNSIRATQLLLEDKLFIQLTNPDNHDLALKLVEFGGWNKKPENEIPLEGFCDQGRCDVEIGPDKIREGFTYVLWVYDNQLEADLFFEIHSLTNNIPDIILKDHNGLLLLDDYLTLNSEVMVQSLSSVLGVYVNYYSHAFTPADPPTGVRNLPSRALIPDTVYFISNNVPFKPLGAGLYFFQNDTSQIEGMAIRVEKEAYPGYNELVELKECMVYITSGKEWKKLNNPALDKKIFDGVWLEMAGNTSDAGEAIRTYFRRVKKANEFFTNYKEGWKTDMGIIYIIFGPPQEVNVERKREVWHYTEALTHDEVEFIFEKRPNRLSPDNKVLLRDNHYSHAWNYTIDRIRRGKEK